VSAVPSDRSEQVPVIVCESGRLRVRRMVLDDGEFLLRQLNEPSWHRHIGDRGVRNLDDARRYIETKTFEQYRTLGYGMNVVELRASGEPVGVCGLVKRAYLDCPDVGFALLEAHWGQGYAVEAAAAVVAHAHDALDFVRLAAITTLTNEASGQVLVKLGFRLEDERLRTPEGENLNLYFRRREHASADRAGMLGGKE
jgi:RimJ/RimL family protein N-acetyltransferase